ncbi:hypothetical protein N665_0766s0001 [Sinapis alba]|nr:hypothetical protein N665_0766s0001 [Sinapis alba]
MNKEPILSYVFSHQTQPTATNPRRTLQVYINRPNTEQSIIDFQLPSITDNQENETCTVCFGNYHNETYLCSIPCGHTFHFRCISQWLRTNISCPVCRDNLL